jgi:putative PIN family toxin of toxin-antitoxin system
MKIVIDTNVFISAFVFKGRAATVYHYCASAETIFISEWILEELTRILHRKFDVPEADIQDFVALLSERCSLAHPTSPLPAICRDPDDNHILQLAEHIAADFLVTGDKDLLSLGSFASARIVTPGEFSELFGL